LVAWTEGGSRSLLIARGRRGEAPRGRQLAITLPAGHRVDEIAIVSRGTTPTAAWIESWSDALGAHSQALAADLARGAHTHTLSGSAELASGLSLAADSRGDQLAAWSVCSPLGQPCALHSASRPARRGFAPSTRLGRIDATETPQASLAPSGEALVGWVSSGRVLVADRARFAGGFGSARVISRRATFAGDLALTFGPAGQAIAAWTQGTFRPSVVAARYR
jgi:hypothetical protein